MWFLCVLICLYFSCDCCAFPISPKVLVFYFSLSLSRPHRDRSQDTIHASVFFVLYLSADWVRGKRGGERERENITLWALQEEKWEKRDCCRPCNNKGACRWVPIFIYMGPPAPKEMEPKGGKSKALKKPGRPLKAEKKLASEGSSKSSKASRKAKRGIETYKIYIYKVLKQVHSLTAEAALSSWFINSHM